VHRPAGAAEPFVRAKGRHRQRVERRCAPRRRWQRPIRFRFPPRRCSSQPVSAGAAERVAALCATARNGVVVGVAGGLGRGVGREAALQRHARRRAALCGRARRQQLAGRQAAAGAQQGCLRVRANRMRCCCVRYGSGSRGVSRAVAEARHHAGHARRREAAALEAKLRSPRQRLRVHVVGVVHDEVAAAAKPVGTAEVLLEPHRAKRSSAAFRTESPNLPLSYRFF
jgi:hypothetical protein